MCADAMWQCSQLVYNYLLILYYTYLHVYQIIIFNALYQHYYYRIFTLEVMTYYCHKGLKRSALQVYNQVLYDRI